MLYIANVGEDEIGDDENDKVKTIREYAAKKILKLSSLAQKSRKKLQHLMMKIKKCFRRLRY